MTVRFPMHWDAINQQVSKRPSSALCLVSFSILGTADFLFSCLRSDKSGRAQLGLTEFCSKGAWLMPFFINEVSGRIVR